MRPLIYFSSFLPNQPLPSKRQQHRGAERRRSLLGVGIPSVPKAEWNYYLRLRRSLWGSFHLLDHFDQVSKGFGAHLLHCPAAMNLHCVFRGSEFISDLLIKET